MEASAPLRWDFDPVLVQFELGTWAPELRWYGVCFMVGLLLGAWSLPGALERRGLSRKYADPLTIWAAVGMIIGAHLIHLIFYEPESFIENPIRILQIGLGLASHGGGLGAVLAVALFSRKEKIDFHRTLDVVMVGAAWVIPWVRVGNFFNSEIYGRATDLPWGVVFVKRGLAEPRHPSQIYKALIGFALVGLTVWLDRKYGKRLRPGALFYLILGIYFTTRFFIEYVKEYQVMSASFPLTMGQMLSLPVALFLLYMALFSKKHSVRKLLPSSQASEEQSATTTEPGSQEPEKKPDEDDDPSSGPEGRVSGESK